jgi:hypothetical protein
MALCTNYAETLEMFAYMIVYAPGFPERANMTLERAFRELRHGIDCVEARTRKPESLEKVSLCRAELDKAWRLFQKGDDREAGFCVQRAEDHFAQLKG